MRIHSLALLPVFNYRLSILFVMFNLKIMDWSAFAKFEWKKNYTISILSSCSSSFCCVKTCLWICLSLSIHCQDCQDYHHWPQYGHLNVTHLHHSLQDWFRILTTLGLNNVTRTTFTFFNFSVLNFCNILGHKIAPSCPYFATITWLLAFPPIPSHIQDFLGPHFENFTTKMHQHLSDQIGQYSRERGVGDVNAGKDRVWLSAGGGPQLSGGGSKPVQIQTNQQAVTKQGMQNLGSAGTCLAAWLLHIFGFYELFCNENIYETHTLYM